MAMERLAEFLQQRGRLGDSGMAEKLREHVKNVGDAPMEEVFPKNEHEASQLPAVRTEGQLVIQSPRGGALRAAEFQFTEQTPELIHALYFAFWENFGQQVGDEITVPKPEFNQAELDLANKNGLTYMYMPPKYANPDALPIFTEVFPFTQGPYTYDKGAYKYEGDSLNNASKQEGWFTVERSSSTPLVNTPRQDAEGIIRALGREGLTLNSYIVGSVISKALTNHYWDEGTHARLFGTLYKNDPLVVTTRPENGVLVIQKLSEIGEGSHPLVGTRTAGLTPNYGRDPSAQINIDTDAHPLEAIRRSAAEIDRAVGIAIKNIFGRR